MRSFILYSVHIQYTVWWGGQSWPQPPFRRHSGLEITCKEPAKSRLRPGLATPQKPTVQSAGPTPVRAKPAYDIRNSESRRGRQECLRDVSWLSALLGTRRSARVIRQSERLQLRLGLRRLIAG